MTNYEKIKAMSVEEMAEYLGSMWYCSDCPLFLECEDEACFPNKCSYFAKQWLESEAEEDG